MPSVEKSSYSNCRNGGYPHFQSIVIVGMEGIRNCVGSNAIDSRGCKLSKRASTIGHPCQTTMWRNNNLRTCWIMHLVTSSGSINMYFVVPHHNFSNRYSNGKRNLDNQFGVYTVKVVVSIGLM
jgi:hypothetical protein